MVFRSLGFGSYETLFETGCQPFLVVGVQHQFAWTLEHEIRLDLQLVDHSN